MEMSEADTGEYGMSATKPVHQLVICFETSRMAIDRVSVRLEPGFQSDRSIFTVTKANSSTVSVLIISHVML